MTDESTVYTDPTTSPRPSPLITAASQAKTLGAGVTGLINLAAMAGLVGTGVAGDLNVAVAIVLGAVPVVTAVAGQLWQAGSIVRQAWPKVTPIDAPRLLDASGRLVRLVAENAATGRPFTSTPPSGSPVAQPITRDPRPTAPGSISETPETEQLRRPDDPRL